MAKKKHSALGKRLIASAKEMVAHAKGALELDEYEFELKVIRPAGVKATSRHNMGHSGDRRISRI